MPPHTTAKLSWTNGESETATGIVVEQSEDNRSFHEIARLPANAVTTTVSNLVADKIYYFRMKTMGDDGLESLYSSVVSVNDEYMRPGGGIPGGVTYFAPEEGKVYRIINYATKPFDSSTTYQGAPKYLTFNSNGTLGSTEQFVWDDPDLLWIIEKTTGGLTIRNYGNKKYIASVNSDVAGTSRIGWSDAPTTLTVSYTGSQDASQSGLYGKVSMFRINSPSNSNQQIRFDNALQTALQLAAGAYTDVTLGYPTSALNELMSVIAYAQVFRENISEQTQQEEINARTAALENAMTAFSAQKIYTFQGFSTDVAYNIYSYGTHPNAGTAVADLNTGRRYLYAIKTKDAKADSLIYRIGRTENDFNKGQGDVLWKNRAALWVFEDAGDGYVYVRNLSKGTYLRIETVLSKEPVKIHPYYAKMDNGKMAFYMDADASGKRMFNVGASADGVTGPLEFFAAHADRTRLRWVIEETSIENDLAPTGIGAIQDDESKLQDDDVWYDMNGRRLNAKPARKGIYINNGNKFFIE